MFKSNKFFYFIIGAVTTLFLAIPVYADQNIFNVTPLQNETWTAGETKTVTWTNNISFICASDSGSVVLSLGLFALGADGTPIYRASGGGQYIYDYPGVFVSPTSGTIGLPANAVPGQYKVVARCFNPPTEACRILFESSNLKPTVAPAGEFVIVQATGMLWLVV